MTISLKYTEIQKVLAEYADKELVSRILKEFEFGKVLFGDKFSQFQRKPKEHDTKPEEVALDDIVTFIDGSGKTEKQRIQKAAPFYKSIKSKAPKILKQPEGWVFRGTKIRAKTMFTMFETKEQFINWSADMDIRYDRVFSIIDIKESNIQKWGDSLPFYRNVKKRGLFFG